MKKQIIFLLVSIFTVQASGHIYQTWDCDGNGTTLLTTEEPIPFVNLDGMYLGCALINGTDAEWVDMTGAILSGCDLNHASLWYISFEGVNLSNADLTDVFSNHTWMVNAKLQGATLTDAVFANAVLHGAQLQGANLERLDIAGSEFQGANFSGAYMYDLWGAWGEFQNVIMDGVNMQWAQINNSHFQGAIMTNSYLADLHAVETDFTGTDFSGSNLSYANFRDTILVDAKFIDATLTGINFDSINFRGHDPWFPADVSLADFTGANVTRARMEDIVGWETATWTDATYDDYTEFPPGMDPTLLGMIYVYSTFVVSSSGGTGTLGSIQEAIDAAIDGCEILIMPGTYTDIHQQVIDPDGKKLWIHGDGGAAVTFIDGQNMKKCVWVHSQETNETIFEGLTFINGYAQHGAGMWVANGSPRVIDCDFKDNNSYGWGGGMYVNGPSSPIVTGCVFVNNTALDGGGLKNYGNNPMFDNCAFLSNSAENGGGIQNYASTAQFVNCTITGNIASESGGGVHNVFGSTPNFTGCGIDQNNAINGGGVRNEATSEPTFTDCFINFNAADIGGGIENHNSNPKFFFCEVQANVAPEGGGMISLLASNPELTDSLFCQNVTIDIVGPYSDLGGNTICLDDQCSADLNADGLVNVEDLLLVIAAWGNAGGVEDINEDGVVGVDDLLELIAGWGVCP